MWTLQATLEGAAPIEEQYRRQGTAYRRARRLYAAGYSVVAIQYSIDEEPVPLGVFQFDGIRFVRIPELHSGA
jgi:hypothetical protein